MGRIGQINDQAWDVSSLQLTSTRGIVKRDNGKVPCCQSPAKVRETDATGLKKPKSGQSPGQGPALAAAARPGKRPSNNRSP
jgi:hypothetical protein